MWRTLFLLAWIPFLWQPVWGQSPSVGIKKTIVKPPDGRSGGDSYKRADERGSEERPIVVDTEGHHQSDAERAQSDAKEQRAREVERWTLYFAQLSAWATVALVLIGFGGVVAAILTLRKIANQAELMERQASIMDRQADLMQAQFDQWIDIVNWKAIKGTSPAFEPYDFRFTADLVNRSGFPVTITEGHIQVGSAMPFDVGGLSLSPSLPNPIQIDVPSALGRPTLFPVEWSFSHRHRFTKEIITRKHNGLLTWIPSGEGKWDAQLVTFTPRSGPESKN